MWWTHLARVGDNDTFRCTLRLEKGNEAGNQGNQATTHGLSEVQKNIIELIKVNPYISRKKMSLRIENITEDGIKYHLQKLQQMGILRREGPDFGGRWVVLVLA